MSDVKDATEAKVEAIAEEARSTFNLRDRLSKKRKFRTKELILITDEETAEKLGGTRPKFKYIGDYPIEDGHYSWGVLGTINELTAANIDGANDEKIADLEKEAAELRTLLLSTSIEVDLRAIPPILERDARRVAKKALGITGKNIPEDQTEDFEERQATEILVRMVTRLKDHSDGAETTSITIDDADALNDLLPSSEIGRLSRAMGNLRFENVVSDAATEQVDFS